MARGEKCRISNCTNIITHKGTVCGTHKWRMKKFNSYDLPSHKGEINFYVPFPEFPEGIVKRCPNHGDLTANDVYPKYYKNAISSYNCKQCTRARYVIGKYEGINSHDDYQKLYDEQKGLCKICEQPETMMANNKTSIKMLSVDHCHTTQKIRGLLCCACNSGIGYFKESTKLLQSAINYLKSSDTKVYPLL